MPPIVITSSPGASWLSISCAARCFAFCGRMSRKYITANIPRRTMRKPLLPTADPFLAGRDPCVGEPGERVRPVRGEPTPLDRRTRAGGHVEEKTHVVN